VKKWLLDGPTIAPLIQNEPPDAPAPLPRWAEPVAFAIGEAIAKIHNINLVHGDLTTSNMILRGGQRYHIDGIFDTTAEPTRLALLDFGLSSAAGSTEEKGVDLYVLERALLSTHTKIAVSFFDAVLKVYYETLTPGSVSAIKAKFEAVRLRGRKRLFFG
jgi:TP53 regulating kinase-like protein